MFWTIFFALFLIVASIPLALLTIGAWVVAVEDEDLWYLLAGIVLGVVTVASFAGGLTLVFGL